MSCNDELRWPYKVVLKAAKLCENVSLSLVNILVKFGHI